MKKSVVFCVIVALNILICVFIFAEDGTYDAEVTTNSGIYAVTVDVKNGAVTCIHWPHGDNTPVYRATIEDDFAEGVNAKGDPISITLQDYTDAPEEA